MKRVQLVSLIGLMASLAGWPASADDTEIFFGAPDTDSQPSMVMLSLDWRSNLSSPQCTFNLDTAVSDCDDDDKLGPDIYQALVDEGKLSNGEQVSLFDSLRGVLRVVFDEVAPDGFQIGLMMSHQHENNCTATDGSLGSDKGCSDGGYILRGFEVVDESAEGVASKEELLDILKNVPLPDASPGSGHSYQGRELFFEFYRYLTGGSVLNGHKGWSDFNSKRSGGKGLYNLDRDYAANSCDFTTDRGCEDAALTFPNTRNLDQDDNVISPWVVWDKGIEDPATKRYISPYTDGDYSCSKTYTINFLFQVSNQDADWNTAISKDIGNGTNEQGLELANTSGDNAFPEIIAKLHSFDHASSSVGVNVPGTQDVTSFFIVDQVNTKTRAYAEAGGTTNPYDSSENPQQLLDDLIVIFKNIASVSTTFTAASVPVNVQNRTESLPDMFLAIFKVDEAGKPFWPGNVKKLRIETELLENGTTATNIVDFNGNAAFNPTTGRISDNALTFWTDPAADDVQNADADLNEVAGKDGSSITRGGAGQKIPGYRENSGTSTTIAPTAANGTWASGELDGRQLFLNPASVSGTSANGNALVPLDADSSGVGSLAEDAEIQKLLGVLIEDELNPGTYITNTSFVTEIESLSGENFGLSISDAERAIAAQILLKWVRGIDVFDWDADGDTDDARPWMMGDPLHSRPLTLNYGNTAGYPDSDNPDIRIIYGSNDGFLHSVRNTTSAGADSGVEEWAFMPRELLANVKELIDQSFVGENKPYGVDLPPVSFVIDNDRDGVIERGAGGNDNFCTPGGSEQDPSDDIPELDCDKAYVYVGLRRGGKSYYALDVSDPEDKPTQLWQIINDGSSTDFAELGLSFSTPRQAWVQFEDDTINQYDSGAGIQNVPVPVLIFGGGLYGGWNDDGTRVGRDDVAYDVATDSPAGHDPVGAALFIVHARTGQLLWKAVYGNSTGGVSNEEYHHEGLIHSIPAAVTPVDSDGNGITDRVYVGDTGGVIWRFELPEYNSSHDDTDTDYHSSFRQNYWRATKLAELGGSVGSVNDRRFYHGLSVVKSRDSIGAFDGIAIGSGDRTHPQSAPTDIQNWFFLIKDRIIYADANPTDSAGVDGRSPYVIGDLLDVTNSCINDSDNDADSGNDCSGSDLLNGWKLLLEETGEKNLSIPLISGGNINFTTYLPEGGEADSECAPNIGISRLYQVAIRDGSPDIHLHSHLEGDTLSKTDRYLDLASGIDGGVTAISPEVGLAGAQQTKLGDQRPNTFYWRELGVDVLDASPSSP